MKLDAVRRYRAQVEDVMRMELLLARQKLQDAEATCQVLGVQAQATVERYLVEVRAGMPVEECFEWQATCDAEDALLTHARQVEGRLRDEWHRRQQDLRDAMQERRTVDRLAERQRQQQRVMQYRAEQMQMDESARRTSGIASPHEPL